MYRELIGLDKNRYLFPVVLNFAASLLVLNTLHNKKIVNTAAVQLVNI